MASKEFGYIRVSSKDQNEARQVENMKKEGIDERDIIVEKASGKDFKSRPKYQALKQMVREGDTVIFDSITRMGRNMKETVKEYEWFVDHGVNLVFIKEPMINTNNEQDDIIKEALQKAILTILSAFAEKERKEIRTRQKEGIEVAKKQGVQFGRPQILITDEFMAIYDQWKGGVITGVEATAKAKVSKGTFYKWVKQIEGK